MIFYSLQDCAKTDPCCDGSTCLLKYWADCRTGECCHNCTVGRILLSFSIQWNIYTPALKKGGGVYCFSSVPPVLPSIMNIFHCTFLNNHVSQLFQTWYGALARGPTRRLPNSGPPVIYFLFLGSVHFWILHLGIPWVYLVSKNSQISFLKMSFFLL